MLRSFDYAAAVGKAPDPTWLPAVRAAFLAGYRSSSEGPGGEEGETVLAALELDKALYEAVYEARNRPDWSAIPRRGLKALTGAGLRG
jgi:maltokinase